MKYIFKITIFLTALFIPFCLHATDNPLLEKLNGAWYNDNGTVIFDFDNNEYTMIEGINEHKYPFNITKQIANALFFEVNGKKFVIRYLNPEYISLSVEGSDGSDTLFRWHEDK